MPATILITGANRGIGLEFVRQYLENGDHVIAACRSPENASQLLPLKKQYFEQLEVHPLDVNNQDQIDSLKIILAGRAVDILINNAGIMAGWDVPFGQVVEQDCINLYRTNVVAPIKLCEALVENLQSSRRKLIIFISSILGSITENKDGGMYAYRASKCALNAVMKSISIDLKDRGITAISLHPGWVQTDMGGENATISPKESVTGLRQVIGSLKLQDTGKFLSYDGTSLSW